LASDTRNDLLASIEQDTMRMTRFLGNIMDMTRLESGQIVPNLEPVDLRDAVEEALARVPSMWQVSVDLPDDLPPVWADAMLLEQVLVNILENATKYSPTGAQVRIAAAASTQSVRIGIADEGVGIPQSDLPHVFDSFYRAHRGDRTVPGTGLGLAIARGLTEAMGGTIVALSPRLEEEIGEMPGTEIVLTLKRAP
jgi:two-component system sensor histidine kinase KdpD